MPQDQEFHPPHGTTVEFDAIVIGAGLAGIYMIHQLRELGLTVRAFEVGADVGGTWYWNRYPGARCDSESWMYCYSFDQQIEQEWQWSSRYPDQPEILEYINFVADRIDVRRDIEFNSRVQSAVYDSGTGTWTVTTESGFETTSRYVITAVGNLSAAQIPDIEGLSHFHGQWYHTGNWPHSGVDLSDKRVAVIGTGSSGTQLIPVIAEQAKQLTVFQRTPNFSVPARNHKLAETQRNEIKRNIRTIRDAAKHTYGGFSFDLREGSILDLDSHELRQFLESEWSTGGNRILAAGFPDVLRDDTANKIVADFFRDKISEVVDSPEVLRKLLPWDHPVGAKRIVLDTNYFETYNRDNVELVSVREEPISTITSTGIRAGEREFDVDVIIFATGFDAMTGSLTRIDIRGRDGIQLKEKWNAGPRTYLGLSVAGFPNLFMVTGPGSPSVLTNMPVAIEQHVEWIRDCIAHLEESPHHTIEAVIAAEDEWVDHVNEIAVGTLYLKANSWFLGANVPGKPRIFMPYVNGMGAYRKICDDVAHQSYRGFAFASNAAAPQTE